MSSRQSLLAGFLSFFLLSLLSFQTADAAILRLGPTSGTFTVGSTFEISLFLDTEDKSINVIEASLSFPPDKIQIVSPSTGQSIIGVWTAQPKFNNQIGRIDLQGGVPGGINVSNGLITKITFRVRGVGSAIVKFLDNSKILQNDGLGTDVLMQTQSGVYKLSLPPPAGPIVASETHPDQFRWYSNPTVILSWAHTSDVGGYSYVISGEPVDFPDDISEGVRTSVAYKNLADGVHYFHIKALRQGAWGGVTHFALSIDIEPPAEYPIEISPSSRTTSKNPIIRFGTTDVLSGLDHYEYKLVYLGSNPEIVRGNENFFIEARSPQVLGLKVGDYDVIVRAHDKAGNFRESVERLSIVTPLFQIIEDKGIRINDAVTIPWVWVWIITGFIVIGLGYGAWRVREWHLRVHVRKAAKEMPSHIKSQLRELKKYRQKYGKALVILLILGAGLANLIGLIGPIGQVFAQQVELAPPFVSTVSRDISNEEIFYIGGKTDAAKVGVTIYLQNLQSGETLSESVVSNKNGDWFYRHPTFLSTGNYLLWAQTKLGELTSPPSPQIQMAVRPTAIQFGASRLSFETLYFIIALMLFLAVVGLVSFIIFHAHHGRKKHKAFWKEVKEAEESIHRGFGMLRRDIEMELAIVKHAKSRKLSEKEKEEEERVEAQLLKDLDEVQKYISKEVRDIEITEHTD